MQVANQIKPNFLGVGQAKCATTWIAEVLRSHPDIFMTTPKEIDFFSQYWEKGMDWYLAHYEKSEMYKVRGEFSVSYLDHPDAIHRITSTIGNPKIIISIRDPVERFISNCKHLYNRGKIADKQMNLPLFRQYVAQHPQLIESGFYIEKINTYLKHFGEKQVLVLLKEKIDQDPASVAKQLFAFLEVDTTFHSPLLHESINQGSVTKYKKLEKIILRLYKWFQKTTPSFVLWLRKIKVVDRVRNLLRKGNSFEIHAEVIDELKQIYQGEIAFISNMLKNP